MPVDAFSDDDDDKELKGEGGAARLKDFDCPVCNANNPCEPYAGEGDEVMCHYCGTDFDVRLRDGGRLVLKEK